MLIHGHNLKGPDRGKMRMSLDYPERMLEICGISQPELKEQIHILEKYLGETFIDTLFKRYNGLDVSLINQICERSVLLEALATVLGFSKIQRRIVDSKNHRVSLDEPHGEWFQLTVGYLLISVNEQLIFEQKIDGIPKDILIRDGNIHIECRSFRGSEASSKALTKLLLRGETPSIKSDNHDGFTVSYGVITSIPSWPPNPSYTINEYQRFFEKAIDKKQRQLLSGKCNLITFNSDLFVGNIQSFRSTLTNLLHSYPRISGLLVIRKEHKLPGDPFKLLGSAYEFELLANEQAEIPIPLDVQHALKPQIKKIALRP